MDAVVGKLTPPKITQIEARNIFKTASRQTSSRQTDGYMRKIILRQVPVTGRNELTDATLDIATGLVEMKLNAFVNANQHIESNLKICEKYEKQVGKHAIIGIAMAAFGTLNLQFDIIKHGIMEIVGLFLDRFDTAQLEKMAAGMDSTLGEATSLILMGMGASIAILSQGRKKREGAAIGKIRMEMATAINDIFDFKKLIEEITAAIRDKTGKDGTGRPTTQA